MDAHKLQLKIYLTPESARTLDVEALIPGVPPLDQAARAAGADDRRRQLPARAEGTGRRADRPRRGLLPRRGRGAARPAPQPQARRAAAGRAAGRSGAADAARGGAAGEGPRADRQDQVRDRRAPVPRERPPGGAEHRRDVRGAAPGAGGALRRRCSAARSSWPAWAARRSCSRVRIKSPDGAPLATLLERAGGPPAADASLVV